MIYTASHLCKLEAASKKLQDADMVKNQYTIKCRYAEEGSQTNKRNTLHQLHLIILGKSHFEDLCGGRNQTQGVEGGYRVISKGNRNVCKKLVKKEPSERPN